MLSVSIKSDDDREGLEEVSRILITNKFDHPDQPEWNNYKYTIQEPGGAILEGTVANFHRDRGALTLLALAISEAGHYGKLVQVPVSAVADLLGHEKVEEIRADLDEQGD